MSQWSLLVNRMLRELYHDKGSLDNEINSLKRAIQIQGAASDVLPGPFREAVNFSALLREAKSRRSGGKEEL